MRIYAVKIWMLDRLSILNEEFEATKLSDM